MTTLAEVQAIGALKKATTQKEKENYARMIVILRTIEEIDYKLNVGLSVKAITFITLLMRNIRQEVLDRIISEVEK